MTKGITKKPIIGYIKDSKTPWRFSTPWRLERGEEVSIVKEYNYKGYKFCDIESSDGKVIQHVPLERLKIHE